jgi:hypothetical protein
MSRSSDIPKNVYRAARAGSVGQKAGRDIYEGMSSEAAPIPIEQGKGGRRQGEQRPQRRA